MERFCSLDLAQFLFYPPHCLLPFSILPSSFCRSQVFGFVRQEIARAAAAATAAAGGAAPSPVAPKKSGEGKSESESGGGNAEVELADKRDVVLSKLPQLMELNKVNCVPCVADSLLCVVSPPQARTAPLFAEVRPFCRSEVRRPTVGQHRV